MQAQHRVCVAGVDPWPRRNQCNSETNRNRAIAEKKKQAIIAATEGIKNLEDVLNAFRAALTGFEIDRFFQARLDRFTECASQYAALQLAAAAIGGALREHRLALS